ncbi:zinc finger protein 37-like isoform X8 [Coccinella septempunctata]|uniref:zinc finger protein 37-like isoform X8 n=1 Tax=Coccinella septempunctata TaxID=41139 RepID=UPI001D07EA00|nr:zinc finger protein 37-like isoform X8 [Coccinella septempunctata]
MINSSDILQLCRLCLVEDKVNHPIFEESDDLRSISLKISSCLPVSIHKDDSLPKKICDTCSTKLDSFYQFWSESANAEKQLLQWVDKNKTSKQQADQSRKMETTEVKKELEDTVDPIDMTSEAQTYILQQQQLPYTSSAPNDSLNTSESEEPAAKRPRRASAVKALQHMGSEDEDDAELAADNYAKTESDDSDKEEEDEDSNYQENPSTTSVEDQPGPSGMSKKKMVLDDTPKTIESRRKDKSWLRRENKNKENIVETDDEEGRTEEKKSKDTRKCNGNFEIKVSSKYKRKKCYKKDDPRNIPCKICNRRFTFNHLLKIHFHNDVEKNEYRCSLCADVFGSDFDLKAHLTDTHSKEAHKLKCDHCGKGYTYEGDLSRHIRIKHEGFIHKCDKCGKAFNKSQALQEHIHIKHDETYVKPKYPCVFCEKFFSCKKTLTLHTKNIHYGMRHFYVCDMCGKSLATPNSFRNHLRTHTKDKPFECSVCGKRFGRNHHLQDHLVTHTKEKPHICSRCGKAFTQRAPLLRHMKCVHETARPYQCLICSKSFATKSLLNSHSKLHNVIN